METLGLMITANNFAGAKVLITGNSGFKGSWLQLWLQLQGAEVTGLSLPPSTNPNHRDCLFPEARQSWIDVRDSDKVKSLVAEIKPDVIFHLAAQPLVRDSYRDPIGTWQTNVLGTANVLDACRDLHRPCAVVIATSDKCYLNKATGRAFVEDDPLGGKDPYSASKAAAEILASSYRDSFFGTDSEVLVATVRAGNVIGGGDWSDDRLVPDAVRACFEGHPLKIRYPQATRPWQHVLEATAGYTRLAAKLIEGDRSFARSWNFGPQGSENRPVIDVLSVLAVAWPQLTWAQEERGAPQEAPLLALDSSLAYEKLGWRPVWDFTTTIARTVEWYDAWYSSSHAITEEQITAYQQEVSP
ncbi:CDP-glucose 4,6-dehydratase [Congregibacter sp.]|jgi:CDP-glucose 4,6-dehydratase|uniref:CDP-glucose 4,6-dehydratase n=1 Tax=Congregibacter sp. TaxID=2744308 RepID=UPI0039E33D0B